MTTIRVYTTAGIRASKVGSAFGSLDGVDWRDSVDRCDSDGGGRVFLDVDDDAVEFVCSELEAADGVDQYEVMA